MRTKNFLDMQISELVFGCDSVGHRLPDDLSYTLLDRYIEAGGNFLDSARIYSEYKSEAFIARYLKDRNLKNKVYVATKAGHPPLSDLHQSRISYEEIESDINTSLKELETDCIDLLYLHRDDVSQPAGEILEMMNRFIRQGKIRHFAVSNWRGLRIQEANAYANAHKLSPIVASSILYNIAKHNGHPDDTLVIMDETELSYYEESGIPVFAYSSQARGFFEKYILGAPIPDGTAQQYMNTENTALAETLKALSEKTGKTVSELSLERLISESPFPVFPIIGVSTTEQLNQILW